MASVEEQKSRLAAILRDLHEGVLVCNLMHQVLLYNQTALTLLQVSGDLGLGRNLLQVMLAEPILHTLDRLTLRVRERHHQTTPEATTAQFVGGSSDGQILFQGRMSLILHDDGLNNGPIITGYVVTFTDATRELAALGQRDALLREATEGLRPPVANLRVMLETLADHPDLDAEALASFEQAMMAASEELSSRLEHLSTEYRDLIAGSWPMSDLRSHNLISLIIHRVGDKAGYRVIETGLPQLLHGDSYSLVMLFNFLLARLHETTGVTNFYLSAEPAERWVYVDIAWTGVPPVASSVIDGWMGQPLADALGGLTVGDALKHHRSDLWSESAREDHARLRVPLPLPPAQRAVDQARSLVSQGVPPGAAPAARQEFFDFSLLLQPLATSGLGKMPLDELSFVAFDSETTGLSPSSGDELISIAGVRIVKGRLLTGETFSALINPRRKISAESLPIHGITDAMVQDQPGAEEVLPRFKAFVADSVLVAHNAAFDLKFLKLKEAATGVRFTNPVLDTMLLSRQLQGKGSDHTLDGIAARLGIQVLDRHTALGDAMVTAAVFLRMIDMLRERDVLTLDDAIRSANILVELHARERAF
ncbi:DNA polymerase III subunit epsilon [uncultured Gammaproteobacteria bacterium]